MVMTSDETQIQRGGGGGIGECPMQKAELWTVSISLIYAHAILIIIIPVFR